MTIKSGLPIAYYFWLILSTTILFAFFFFGNNPFYAVFMFLVVSALLFIILAQCSCSFILNENVISFKYLLSKPKQVEILKVKRVKFELSYFYFFEEDFKMGIYYWFRPYDIMYLYYDKQEQPIVIKFNSSFKGTLKLCNYLKEKYHIPYWEMD